MRCVNVDVCGVCEMKMIVRVLILCVCLRCCDDVL